MIQRIISEANENFDLWIGKGIKPIKGQVTQTEEIKVFRQRPMIWNRRKKAQNVAGNVKRTLPRLPTLMIETPHRPCSTARAGLA